MLSRVSKQKGAAASALFHSRLSHADAAVFAKALGRYVSRGYQVTRALETLSESSNRKVARAAQDVLRRVADGISIDDAFEQSGMFPPEMIAVVRAALSGGSDRLYQALAETMAFSRDIRKRVMGLVMAPLGYLSMLIIVAGIFATTLIPSMLPMLKSKDELTSTARMLLDIKEFVLTNSWGVTLGVAVFAIVSVVVLLKVDDVRLAAERAIYAIPGVGRLLLMMDVSRACAYLGLLVEVDRSAMNALRMTSDAVGFLSIRKALMRWRRELESGYPVEDAFQRSSNLWPAEMRDAIRSGIGSGTLPAELVAYSKLVRDEIIDMIEFIKPKVSLVSILVGAGGTGWLFVDVVVATMLKAVSNLS